MWNETWMQTCCTYLYTYYLLSMCCMKQVHVDTVSHIKMDIWYIYILYSHDFSWSLKRIVTPRRFSCQGMHALGKFVPACPVRPRHSGAVSFRPFSGTCSWEISEDGTMLIYFHVCLQSQHDSTSDPWPSIWFSPIPLVLALSVQRHAVPRPWFHYWVSASPGPEGGFCFQIIWISTHNVLWSESVQFIFVIISYMPRRC